jgi:dsDNA-binding SOS-regulon protein
MTYRMIVKNQQGGLMEMKKKGNRILIGLACLVVFALIGYAIYQHRQISALSKGAEEKATAQVAATGDQPVEKAAPVQAEATQAVPLVSTGKETEEKKAISDQLDAAKEELDMANRQLSEEAAKKTENARKMVELQKKMLQDPANKKMYMDTIKGALDSMYGTLFERLDLTPERLAELKESLADQVMSSLEISQDMLDLTASEEKRKEVQGRFEEAKKESDAKLAELLGETGFKTYETYTERLSERQLVSGFATSLGDADKLTDAQQDAFIDTMYQARKDLYSREGYDEKEVTFLSETSEDGSNKIIKMMDQTYDSYLKAAGSTLSASQTEALKTYLKQKQDMTETALKIYGIEAADEGGVKQSE